MDKTIKINLAGVLFQVNEDGFEMLRDYLQDITRRLKNFPGGNEMLEDIEARIAEIFQAAPSWKSGIISREDVEEMIRTMGSAEEIAGGLEDEQTGGSSYERRSSEKRMYRDPDNAIIGGVCSGLGNYLRIDPVWIRILFVLFTIVYLSGLFIYIILWIALPKATGPYQRRQMYEPASSARKTSPGETGSAVTSNTSFYSEPRGDQAISKVGNTFNELFKAFGKFFVILFRVLLAIIGVSFIAMGFSLLFSYIIIAFFNSPAIMGNVFDTEIFHLPDFLSFIVNPSLTPWLMVLSSIVIILPLLAIIYWGIRMVFQFHARDIILNISMFIIWIISCTALAMILFSEGISFANSGRTYEQVALPESDTIYLRIDNRIRSLDYDRTVKLPFEKFALYLDEEKRTIYGTPVIDIYPLDKDAPYLQVVKYSNGKTSAEARQKADNLEYNYELRGNTLYLDEYFSIPGGNRWSGASMKAKIYLPAGKIIYIDEDLEDILDDYLGNGIYAYEAGNNYWMITEDGLEEIK